MSNGSAIQIGAGLLGDVVTPHADSFDSTEANDLRRHAGPIDDHDVRSSDITFDQLVSGNMPPDAPGDATEFVAIVHFEDSEAAWWPLVCHFGASMFLPTSDRGASWLGTNTRNACQAESRFDRKKAGTNVAQSTMKHKNGKGGQQFCPKMQIYCLHKVKKPKSNGQKTDKQIHQMQSRVLGS